MKRRIEHRIKKDEEENFSNIHSLIIYGNMIKIYSFEFSIKVKQKKNNTAAAT